MNRIHSLLIVVFFLLAWVACSPPEDDNPQAGTGQPATGVSPVKNHDFKEDLYWSLNESPMQKRLRKHCPFPVSAVYYQQRDHNIDSMRKVFKEMKNLGFTGLKQVMLKGPYNNREDSVKVFNMALDIGISPWYYGYPAAWKTITQKLVDSLGIGMQVNQENMPKIQQNPKMRAFQDSIMRSRIQRFGEKPPRPESIGEPGRNAPFLPERLVPHFADWLEEQYGTVDSLRWAWGRGWTGAKPIESFKGAAKQYEATHTDRYGIDRGKGRTWDIRSYRDVLKFQSELITNNYKKVMRLYTEWDPYEPERTGGHQLFENQALNSWDLEAQAKSAKIGGSFYSSIHLAHHFFLVDGETTKPVYMQARTIADMFKGGWAATWESTGGPTQWSGYTSISVDSNKIRQLMYSYIAAGLKGIGFWTYNSRDIGWESGEYALTDIQGQPSGRAKVAGKVADALQEQRFELWKSMDEPMVGVLYSWENEALLGRLSMGTYPLDIPAYETMRPDIMAQYHSDARIGISRALLNNQVPFENVTEHDLEDGLAARYPIIYLPYVLGLKDQHLKKLEAYVKNGGNLVVDFPCFMFDAYGRLKKWRKGSTLEQMMGCQVEDYYNTRNRPRKINGLEVEGQFGDLKLTSGKAVASYEDGIPAVVRNSYGKGSVTLLNFEGSKMAKAPGNRKMEDYVIRQTLNGMAKPYEVEGEGVFALRRSAPDADHYFFINESSQEQEVTLRNNLDLTYTKAKDPVSGESIETSGDSFSVTVGGYSAAWVRAVK